MAGYRLTHLECAVAIVGLSHLVVLCLVDTCRRQYYVLSTLPSPSGSNPRRKNNSSSLARRIPQ